MKMVNRMEIRRILKNVVVELKEKEKGLDLEDIQISKEAVNYLKDISVLFVGNVLRQSVRYKPNRRINRTLIMETLDRRSLTEKLLTFENRG